MRSKRKSDRVTAQWAVTSNVDRSPSAPATSLKLDTIAQSKDWAFFEEIKEGSKEMRSEKLANTVL